METESEPEMKMKSYLVAVGRCPLIKLCALPFKQRYSKQLLQQYNVILPAKLVDGEFRLLSPLIQTVCIYGFTYFETAGCRDTSHTVHTQEFQPIQSHNKVNLIAMMAYKSSHLNNCGGRYRHPGYSHIYSMTADGESVLITPNEATSNESLWNPSFQISEATRADSLAVDLSKMWKTTIC